MSDDELFIMGASLVIGLIAALLTRTSGYHPLFVRGANAGVGLIRLSVIASMLWFGVVIWRYADPSVRAYPIYIWFYLVMGYAVVKVFGQGGARLLGARLRLDVVERKNLSAAMLIASFTFATGLIFGGSLWGEADPEGEGEGGWWIPLGFFLLGWLTLFLATLLMTSREQKNLRLRIRQNRSIPDARAVGAFVISTSVIVTEAVAGDFWGWRHGLLGLAVVVLMLVIHEVVVARAPFLPTTAPTGGPMRPGARILESLAYLALAGLYWLLQRAADAFSGVATP